MSDKYNQHSNFRIEKNGVPEEKAILSNWNVLLLPSKNEPSMVLEKINLKKIKIILNLRYAKKCIFRY